VRAKKQYGFVVKRERRRRRKQENQFEGMVKKKKGSGKEN